MNVTRIHACRRGTTLLEMLVSMVLLGIIASVVTLAVRRFDPPRVDDPMTIIADTLATVMESGLSRTLQFNVNGRAALATLNPDGSIIADSALHIERFTGRSTDVR